MTTNRRGFFAAALGAVAAGVAWVRGDRDEKPKAAGRNMTFGSYDFLGGLPVYDVDNGVLGTIPKDARWGTSEQLLAEDDAMHRAIKDAYENAPPLSSRRLSRGP